jgi:alpha 1,6-mannosyltransferase
LIVGIEADSPVPPSTSGGFQVQFAMWTIASSANHPVLWTMIERIVSNITSHPSGAPISDDDVLRISGPMAWSAVLYAAMSDIAARDINYTHFQNLQEPVIFGDILVLPLWAFAADFNDPVSANRALVKHNQLASWRLMSDIIN